MHQLAERFAHSIRISIQIGPDRSAHQEMDLGDVTKRLRKATPVKDRFMLCQKDDAEAQFAAQK